MPDLVTVAQCSSDIDAHLIQQRLGEAGIPSHLANQAIRNLGSRGLHAIHLWVQVAAIDAERARQILVDGPDPLTSNEEKELAEMAEAAGRCPTCGSSDVNFQEARPECQLLDAPAPVEGVCAACGHRWLLE